MIYFDHPTKRMVLEWVSQVMPADGFLFLGGAETVLGVCDAFHPMPDYRGVYRLTPQTTH